MVTSVVPLPPLTGLSFLIHSLPSSSSPIPSTQKLKLSFGQAQLLPRPSITTNSIP
jgi:hypothetical protein